MNFWQILVIVYFALLVVCGLIVDGHPRSGKYSFVDILLTVLLYALVLYEGGFWQ